MYQNHKLFQSKTFTATSNFSQKIISGKINSSAQDPDVSVEMVFNPAVSFPINGNFLKKSGDNYKTGDILDKRVLWFHAGSLVVGSDSKSCHEPD